MYRIFSVVASSESVNRQQSNDDGTLNIESTLLDTFSIVANYRDPFLGKMISINKPVFNSLTKIAKTQKTIQSVQWPLIVYNGMIKNQKSNKQVVMVQINGQSNLMREKEIFAGIELMKIYKDSIEVGYQKQMKIIKK